ncbi:hypothetical protein F5Y14DRAFT_189261 [Nemania sp. NC0429]|nr:hypothetical protein F5Y14DRAFT_189261 [Nemania sp. NC0429]
MPLSREPSQRALNWVKWNSSKTSLNSNSGNKRAAEPEIIHLGGARVGTAFEVLDLPRPDRSSRPGERTLPPWAVNPPPPNPPGIGIAVVNPDGRPIRAALNTATNLQVDNERPVTQWFPEFLPGAEKSKDEPQSLAVGRAAPSHLSPNTDVTTEEEIASPSSFTSSYIATPSSSLVMVSPARSPISPPSDFPEPDSSRSVQFPKRSTSLSQASRRMHPSSAKRSAGGIAPMKAKEIHLRRTQSNAEVARGMERRGSPPPAVPPPEKEAESPHKTRGVSPHDVQVQESQRSSRRSPKPSRTAQDPPVLPPLTSAPPNVPLPPISGTKLAGHGRARDQVHRRGRSTSSDRVTDRSPPPELQEQTDGQQQGSEQKLTSKERLWLHRNYRGEAMFLRAWGLQIASEEDREEGRGILRELMEGEAQEERDSQERQNMHHRSGSQSRSSTATNASGRDTVGLDVIAEERYSREFQFPTNATATTGAAVESRSQADGAGDRFWRTEQESRDQRYRKRSGPESHARNESTDSVLGQYLSLRLNHNH